MIHLRPFSFPFSSKLKRNKWCGFVGYVVVVVVVVLVVIYASPTPVSWSKSIKDICNVGAPAQRLYSTQGKKLFQEYSLIEFPWVTAGSGRQMEWDRGTQINWMVIN